jgi:hypothetical protein
VPGSGRVVIAAAEKPAAKKLARLKRRQENSSRGRGAKVVSASFKAILDAEASAALRERLVAELAVTNSAEEAANWAHRLLGAKNSLMAADAAHIEPGFRAKLIHLESDIADSPQTRQDKKVCRLWVSPAEHRMDNVLRGRENFGDAQSTQKAAVNRPDSS